MWMRRVFYVTSLLFRVSQPTVVFPTNLIATLSQLEAVEENESETNQYTVLQDALGAALCATPDCPPVDNRTEGNRLPLPYLAAIADRQHILRQRLHVNEGWTLPDS